MELHTGGRTNRKVGDRAETGTKTRAHGRRADGSDRGAEGDTLKVPPGDAVVLLT